MNKIIIYFFLSFSSFYSNAQTQKDSLYIWFDKVVGKENLLIYNGQVHLNYDNTSNNQNNRYLNNSDFTSGIVSINSQTYYNQKIKYDVFEDNLIILPENQSYTVPLKLFKEDINYFKIFEKKFIILNEISNSKTLLTGFFEEITIDTSLKLYIKHIKKKRNIIKDVKVVQEYSSNTAYFLKYNNYYHNLKSKNDIVKLFPNQKKEINNYYYKFKQIQDSNPTKFMKDLIILIKNLSQSSSN